MNLFTDKEVVLEFLRKQADNDHPIHMNNDFYFRITDKYEYDEDILKLAVVVNPLIFFGMRLKIQRLNEKDILELILLENPGLIEHVYIEREDYRDLVMVAVKKNGKVLRHVKKT